MKKGIVLLILVGAACIISYAQNTSPYWSIAGNNNATGASKLGTTNTISLHFYTNNVQRMYIDSLNGRVGIGVSIPADRLHVNSASGENAFRAQVNGVTRLLVHSNGGVAIGANTTPPPSGGLYVYGKVGIGTNTPAAPLDVNGNINIAANSAFYIGNKQILSNQGIANLFIGENAGNTAATGGFLTAIGYNTLSANTSGYDNTAVGGNAMSLNTGGAYNSAFGATALYSNTTGSFNTAVGELALSSNTTASSNTALGSRTLYNNNTGYYNTAMGASALFYNTTGYYNTATGSGALSNNTTGYNNTATGLDALSQNTGSNNTALGTFAGYTHISQNNCTFIGAYSDINDENYTNSTALGYGAIITASNQVMLGNSSVTSVMAAGSYVVYSDGRFKNNIKENVPGLGFINLLKPVTYNYDIHGLNKLTGASEDQKRNGTPDTEKAIDNKEKILYTGFVAQDVEAAAKKINYDFSGIHKPQNEKDPYGLAYSDFIVPLVKAVQELSKQNDSLQSANKTQQKQMDALIERMNKLETALASSGNSASASVSPSLQTVELGSVATLEQNIPNPFFNSTTINYYLPQNNGNAYITFFSANGTVLKSVKLSGNGKGTVTLRTSELPSGVYRYNLLVDGKNIDSKQMILAK